MASILPGSLWLFGTPPRGPGLQRQVGDRGGLVKALAGPMVLILSSVAHSSSTTLSQRLAPPSTEFELVRLASRSVLDPERVSKLRAAAGAAADWDRVVKLGAYHKTLPLLHFHLNEWAEDVTPTKVLSTLRAYTRRTSAHILFLLSETARIAGGLEAAGVPFLVLKGPSLAEAYGSVAKRPFIDNDLLIHREDFGTVERVLLDLGFQQRKRSDTQQAAYLSVHGEYTFGRQENGFVSTVDVHTRLVPFGLSYAPSLEDLVKRSRTIRAGGAEVTVLSWEDTFLALAVNALKDQWDRLRLATDLAEVASMVRDWDALVERAEQNGVLRAVHLAVLIVADTVGSAFPEDIVGRARGDRKAVSLAEDAVRFVASSDERGVRPGYERFKLNMLVQDTLIGQLRYAGYAAVRRVTERLVATPG